MKVIHHWIRRKPLCIEYIKDNGNQTEQWKTNRVDWKNVYFFIHKYTSEQYK